MKIGLYPHVTSLNHGCEAIIVSTCEMLREYNDDIYLLHYDRMDNTNLIEKYCNIQYATKKVLKRFSPRWICYIVQRFILNDFYKACQVFALNGYQAIADCDLYLSIGGDNYCYGDPYEFYGMNYLIHRDGKRSVLWGCSIEPSKIDTKMKKDLSRYDLIVVRESITYQALLKCGIPQENIVLKPDPAFTLQPKETNLPSIFSTQKVIGLNLSPMVIGQESKDGIAQHNFENLVRYVLESTEYAIALIPHVTVKTTDDREPLKKIYEKYKDTGRVAVVEDQSCQKLKYIISKCTMFIGARTHATIAAYSSCVPTIVIGYSVKARGIAKDIFGTDKNYVLPVQQLETENDLMHAFQWMMNSCEEIRKHLNSFIPGYIQSAYEAGNLIKQFVVENK